MPEDMVKIKKESESPTNRLCCDGDYYPYGTRLEFENDLIEELGAEALAPGDLVEVRAFAVVERKTERTDEEGTDKDMSLQITSLKVRREESDRAKQLYGK